MLLSDIVMSPSNSLIQKSLNASYHPGYGKKNNHITNADGFGIWWYSNRTPEKHAAVFKDVLPAWSNVNLREICQATYSDSIMAHVRAASPGSGVSQQNCHPFKAGRLLFCHNGRIDSFQAMRRRYCSLLSDQAFLGLRGTTDSEFIFALVLTLLTQDGHTKQSPMTQTEPFGHSRLMASLKKALKLIEGVQAEVDMQEGFFNTCNFSFTDGESMVVTRYCNKSPEIPAPSLYFAFGHSNALVEELLTD